MLGLAACDQVGTAPQSAEPPLAGPQSSENLQGPGGTDGTEQGGAADASGL